MLTGRNGNETERTKNFWKRRESVGHETTSGGLAYVYLEFLKKGEGWKKYLNK